MKSFATLIDSLSDTCRPAAQQRLIARYLARTSDPDRGWALAALAGALELPRLKPKILRAMVEERLDPVLFALSHDYVRDRTETVALVWPAGHGANRAPGLAEVVETAIDTPPARLPELACRWLDALDPSGRYALLRLLGGGVRAGVSPRLVRAAVALFAGKDLSEIEARWHGAPPPYGALLSWAEGRAPPPPATDVEIFRPFMVARTVDASAAVRLAPGDHWAEWHWNGARAQLVVGQEGARLYSGDADDITARFSEIAAGLTSPGVVDGTLLTLGEAPVRFRVHDMLVDGPEDIRALPLAERRVRLERWLGMPHIDLSPILAFDTPADLAALHARARDLNVGGVVLKRRDSAYAEGHWFLWARAPLTANCVLMYVAEGMATFGCWRGEEHGAELVPVGKVMLDAGDATAAAVAAWARDMIVERFGPVAAVSPDLVVEIAFDAVHPSARHKAGFVMTDARLSRIRDDVPPGEAARIEALARLGI